MPQRKRYAIVGTGARCSMYIEAIVDSHRDHARVVGLCDPSASRMAHWNRRIVAAGDDAAPCYSPGDFDRMVRDTRPDAVIVTTIDSEHHRYIIRALELGCDAITEKPITIDAEKASAILDAVDRTGGRVRVTFNYRYVPAVSKMREIIAGGAIGTPTLVDLQWRLDTSHGADYFRRWHREKAMSGGLLVHKSTHHFDLVNWIIGDHPMSVTAAGGTRFYGKANAEARGEHQPYDRYTGEPAAADDPFALRLDADPDLKALYLDAEADSNYIRDRNVFSDRWPLDAEDTLAVLARYRGGAILSYSLVAYCPWEGLRLTVTGTQGQIAYVTRGPGHVIRGQSGATLAAEQATREVSLTLQRMFAPAEHIEVPLGRGPHGGGDRAILDRIFLPAEDLAPDPLGRDADHLDGVASILLGVAANQSIATDGQPVHLDALLRLPSRSDRAITPGVRQQAHESCPRPWPIECDARA